MSPDVLLPIEDAAKQAGFKHARTVYAWLKPQKDRPTFPQPVKLGRSIRFSQREISQFVEALKAKRQAS